MGIFDGVLAWLPERQLWGTLVIYINPRWPPWNPVGIPFFNWLTQNNVTRFTIEQIGVATGLKPYQCAMLLRELRQLTRQLISFANMMIRTLIISDCSVEHIFA